jgi:hypothetical protein
MDYLAPRLLILLLVIVVFACGYKAGKGDADRYWKAQGPVSVTVEEYGIPIQSPDNMASDK